MAEVAGSRGIVFRGKHSGPCEERSNSGSSILRSGIEEKIGAIVRCRIARNDSLCWKIRGGRPVMSKRLLRACAVLNFGPIITRQSVTIILRLQHTSCDAANAIGQVQLPPADCASAWSRPLRNAVSVGRHRRCQPTNALLAPRRVLCDKEKKRYENPVSDCAR